MNYIQGIILIGLCISLLLYIFWLRGKISSLLRSNYELQEILALETTVKSLIEVIRQEENIHISCNIMCNTLANLLKAESMGVYRITENKIELVLGEYFKNLNNKQIFEENITPKFINEATNIKNINSVKLNEVTIKGVATKIITMLGKNEDNAIFLILVFKEKNKKEEDKKVNNFIFQVLYYCTHLTSLILDIKKKVEVEKLIEEKERSEKQAIELSDKLEREIKNSELQNEFIGIISHEFRTPLTVISSSIKLLQININQMYFFLNQVIDRFKLLCTNDTFAKLVPTMSDKEVYLRNNLRLDKIEEQIKNINNYIYKFSVLIENTMKLSLVESSAGKENNSYFPVEINLKTTLEEIILNFKNFREEIDIEFASDSHEHIISFDKISIYLVISNIISNAIKFSKANGKVSISLLLKNNNSMLVVEDQGIGIPKENIGKIFSKFYRAHNAKTISGTGIGLYLVKKLMEFNGGAINIESEIGKGTRVVLSFFNQKPENKGE